MIKLLVIGLGLLLGLVKVVHSSETTYFLAYKCGREYARKDFKTKAGLYSAPLLDRTYSEYSKGFRDGYVDQAADLIVAKAKEN